MKLSEFKTHLHQLDQLSFQLPDGTAVAAHFHVTELGYIQKKFIDCGGIMRTEERANFQLWEADDYDHRLRAEQLIAIIKRSEKVLQIKDIEIEVEYQQETIGKYGITFDGKQFLLTSKKTACLAPEACHVPTKPKLSLQKLQTNMTCDPNSGCC